MSYSIDRMIEIEISQKPILKFHNNGNKSYWEPLNFILIGKSDLMIDQPLSITIEAIDNEGFSIIKWCLIDITNISENNSIINVKFGNAINYY